MCMAVPCLLKIHTVVVFPRHVVSHDCPSLMCLTLLFQVGSVLCLPSLYDISHDCEECGAVQKRSCERQKREPTDFCLCE